MNSDVSVSSVDSQVATVDATRGKVVRVSKKDYFASLPMNMKRAAKEAAFANYAEQFSAMEFAAISGGIANGSVRVRATRPTKSGFAVSLETVKEATPRAGKVQKLEAEIARLTLLIPQNAVAA